MVLAMLGGCAKETAAERAGRVCDNQAESSGGSARPVSAAECVAGRAACASAATGAECQAFVAKFP